MASRTRTRKTTGVRRRRRTAPAPLGLSNGSNLFKVKSFNPSAESVKSEGQANKLTVVGKVDPTKLRDELAIKTKNKVDLVSPKPKKDNKVNKDDANDTKKKKPEKTDNDEKPKEAPLNRKNLRVFNRRNLRVLNLTNLRRLNWPNSTNLTNLRVTGCSKLLKFPDCSKLRSLRYLDLSEVGILPKIQGEVINSTNRYVTASFLR
ncbi:heavy metal-associated isoprenylated plant protein 3 [Prunus yedoensis var. nudiflora]|uniref:Heavy metal-associated isoprenylated plant protein 3 n=1 Tax=Prunus yedoensis var. nudiflora TaxID=2094558 RepID=A0A314ZQE8_PRUYE|nr:heavy metal-associated isoprenylated plant protein 3 [Prunus yedoensis var. nudiflora]